MLWHCWLAGRKGIRPVKTEWWSAAWLSVWSEVQACVWPSWCRWILLRQEIASDRLVLLFWYRPTRVVPDKGPNQPTNSVKALKCVRDVKANSHLHARRQQNCLVCVASASAVWIGFPTTQDCRRQKIWEVWTRSEQSSNSHRHTRHDTDRTVLSCLAGGVNRQRKCA